jgi:hypothetical protein
MNVSPVLFVLATALLAACATFKPTSYQPSVDGGYGYSEEWLSPSEYRITVSGNAATSAQRLWDQLLFRAAELTLADGHRYFAIAPNAAGGLVSIKPAFLTPQFGIGPGGAGVGVRMPLVQYEGLPVGVEPSRQLIATATIEIAPQQLQGSEYVFDARRIKRGFASSIAPTR